MTIQLISLHGGHSGEFCMHAKNNLAEVIGAYQSRGFSWVGISEHMPPTDDRFVFPDERDAGLTAADLAHRFDNYMTACRRLQESHGSHMKILVGFEAEAYSGSLDRARKLIETYAPDYIVGSVHHVDDINFDYNEGHYRKAVQTMGGITHLYHRYFDIQYDMITRLQPQVVGHFDLVRLYDSDYPERLQEPDIEEKIDRNLETIKDLGLILDLNMRALHRGAPEPYPTRSILQKALKLNIPVVPGDDSHGIDTVGAYIREGIDLLKDIGFNTQWEGIIERMGQ